MEFDMVSKMKVYDLKMFLCLRGLKVLGKKAELFARVFAAYENKVQPVKSPAEVEIELQEEYQAKLLQGDYVIPDPSNLVGSWLDEEQGISVWPFITYPEIYNYLMFQPNDFADLKGELTFIFFFILNYRFICVENESNIYFCEYCL